MVKLTKIYTRGGDQGQTSLGDGTRCAKNDLRVDAYGNVDEVNATIGLIRLHTQSESYKDIDNLLNIIQNDLFDLGADLARPIKEDETNKLRISEAQTKRLEDACDHYNEDLSDLTSFILPGGSTLSSYMHLARTITRRAERSAVALSNQSLVNQESIKYLNRLSDLLFILGRFCNDKGQSDILWIPGANR